MDKLLYDLMDWAGIEELVYKRLADVLQQIAVAQPLPFDGGERLAGLAHEAADRVNRGVVAYSGVD